MVEVGNGWEVSKEFTLAMYQLCWSTGRLTVLEIIDGQRKQY